MAAEIKTSWVKADKVAFRVYCSDGLYELFHPEIGIVGANEEEALAFIECMTHKISEEGYVVSGTTRYLHQGVPYVCYLCDTRSIYLFASESFNSETRLFERIEKGEAICS